MVMPDVPRAPGAVLSICRECHSTVRYQDVGEDVVWSDRYCPMCGSQSVSAIDDVVNYWLLFGLDLGLPEDERTTTLVKSIYDLWEPAAGDPIRFADYLKQCLVEMGVVH